MDFGLSSLQKVEKESIQVQLCWIIAANPFFVERLSEHHKNCFGYNWRSFPFTAKAAAAQNAD